MKVTLKEIRKLQDRVSDQINTMKDSEDADYDRLAELRALSFNISMIFLRYSMEKDDVEIELGQSDEKIIEAIKPQRRNETIQSLTPVSYIENATTICKTIQEDLLFLISTSNQCGTEMLRENIVLRLEQASHAVAAILKLKEDNKTQSLWSKQIVLERSEAASIMGRARTAKKAAAARENGKKGGRPRKIQSTENKPEPKNKELTKKSTQKTKTNSTAKKAAEKTKTTKKSKKNA